MQMMADTANEGARVNDLAREKAAMIIARGIKHGRGL